MSVFVSQGTTEVAPPPIVTTPDVVPPRGPLPRLVSSLRLTSGGGAVELLSGVYTLARPSSGFTGSDSELDVAILPGVDGGYIRGADQDSAGLSLSPAQLILTVSVQADTFDPAVTSEAVSLLRRVLASRRYGPATLTVGRGDGAIRTLLVVHQPQEGDFAYTEGTSGTHRLATLRLLAPSPLWRGTPGEAGPWGLSNGLGGSLPARMPFRLAASSVLGEANPVTVMGDELTWPTLPFRGPFNSIQVERTLNGRTRGYQLVHPTGLLAGQSLTIRHDPASLLSGGRQVEGPGGVSWAQFLQPGADLFELVPGDQSIRVLVGSAGTGAQASMSWPTNYWSALDG